MKTMCFSLAAATTTGHLTLKTSMCACWDWTWTWKICVSVVGAISMYACVNLWLLMYSAGGLGIIWAIPVILYFYIFHCPRYKCIVFISVEWVAILSHITPTSAFVHLDDASKDTWIFLITTHISLINLNKRLWIRRSFPRFNHPILWFAMQKWLLMQPTFTLFKTLTKALCHHDQFYNGNMALNSIHVLVY